VWKRNLIVPFLWIILILATSGKIFFWDTIQLASKQAHFFYDNQFQFFFLPEEINSGHPPFYGMFLALFWTIFGKSLLASHIFNGLFVVGFVYQAHRLGQWLLGEHGAFYFPLVLFCNPIFLGHSILVSPDNVLCFLLLLAVNSLLRKHYIFFAISGLCLALLSMRGMMTVAAVGIAEVTYLLIARKPFKWTLVVKYLAAAIGASSFLLAHYFKNDWLGFHEESPWQESFNIVGLKDYVRNLGIIVWRLLDFGNLFIWLTTAYILIKVKLEKKYWWFLLAASVASCIVFVLPLASFKYLSAHRYFMPLYLLLSLGFIFAAVKTRVRKSLIAICQIGLFFRNWCIYPRSISQGWEVSLGHLPYYSLVDKMKLRIHERGIEASDIGTEFPLKTEARYLYLKEGGISFVEGKINREPYILYSKVINDFKDVDYYELQENYQLIEDLSYLFIDLKLYEKRTKAETGGVR